MHKQNPPSKHWHQVPCCPNAKPSEILLGSHKLPLLLPGSPLCHPPPCSSNSYGMDAALHPGKKLTAAFLLWSTAGHPPTLPQARAMRLEGFNLRVHSSIAPPHACCFAPADPLCYQHTREHFSYAILSPKITPHKMRLGLNIEVIIVDLWISNQACDLWDAQHLGQLSAQCPLQMPTSSTGT